jgi:hypothetical protein
MILSTTQAVQLPLIHIVETDDWYLHNQTDLVWFSVLRDLDWRPLRPLAARYYEALWQFNEAQACARQTTPAAPNPESQAQATQRLLFARATLCPETPVVVEPTRPDTPALHVDADHLQPGRVPFRLAGRTPKCFFALFKAFVGMALRGKPPEPEEVHETLRSNPAYARTCGFTLPDPKLGYRSSDVPSLRKLQQFDQIMAARGLWAQAALDQVASNLQEGRIQPEATLVHDTTHYPAFSAFRTVALADHAAPPAPASVVPAAAPGTAVAAAAASGHAGPPPTPAMPTLAAEVFVGQPIRVTLAELDERRRAAASGTGTDSAARSGDTVPVACASVDPPTAAAPSPSTKTKRKSQPRTTKACRCADRHHCPHPWISADDGAGTVVKSTGKMYWAHKASTLAWPGQHILLDAVAVTDAASHDSRSLAPHLDRLFRQHPQLWGTATRVLDDGAADDATLKADIAERFGIELTTPINPRRRQPLTKDLPRGIAHLTNTGTPVCRAGFALDFIGCRHDTGHFLFRAPDDAQGTPVCNACPLRSECCRLPQGARQISVAFERLPWIDPAFPQLSQRFHKTIAQRTAIERIHKLMKYDLGDARLSKRGNTAFQARLDKTLLAMHVLIAQT